MNDAKLAESNNEENERRQPIQTATKAALQSIDKVINYDARITGVNERYDDSTFFSLPNVPDLPPLDDHMIINNNDPMEQQEESTIQTHDYGSVGYMRSSRRELGSVGYTVCTEDGTTIETDASNTRTHTVQSIRR